MKYLHTPLIDRLLKHHEKEAYSFHVPGHRKDQVWPQPEWHRDLLSIDATELTGLDDLHDPAGVIKEAQELTAKSYGADKSYFLVNGSTVGNLAMIMTTCPRGSKVLVQRNSHKSIINGLNLSGAQAIFVTPEIDNRTGLSTGVNIDRIKEAFEQKGPFHAVILTNPNYYGMTNDLTELITYIHQQSVPVLVDEAHGAHFGIGKPFPPSSIAMGADIVVQSAHKTLPAMTMASYIHVCSQRIDKRKLESNLAMLQSSSPSYPLMASLDFARAYRESIDQNDIGAILASRESLVQLLKEVPQISTIEENGNYDWLDPLKLTVRSNTGLSGYELQRLFEEEGIFTELADPNHVLFVLPLSPIAGVEDIGKKIKQAVEHLEVFVKPDVDGLSIFKMFPSVTDQLLTLDEVREKPKAIVPLGDSIGKICAETIIPYPPGIPILLEGERVQAIQVKYCQQLVELGARFQGSSNVRKGQIEIIK